MNPRISMRKPQKQLLLPLFHDFSIIGFSMHSLIMGHLGSDATVAASITSVAQELITCICKGFSSGAGIMVGKLLGQNLFDQAKQYGKKFCHLSFWVGGIHVGILCILGPIVVNFFLLSDTAKGYLVMCADEIVKLPWLYPRYRKYLWLKNLTREEKDS